MPSFSSPAYLLSQTAPQQRPMFRFLLILSVLITAGFQGWTAIYTNFAVNVVGVSGQENGIIQSIRELPGLLSIGVVVLLLFIKESRLMAGAVLLGGFGIAVTGFFPSFGGLMFCALVASFGFHYYEATSQSLTLQYFSIQEAPLVLSRLRSYSAAGNFVIGTCIFFAAPYVGFPWLFGGIGVIVFCGGIWGLFQQPENNDMPLQRPGMVLRKRYWLFYSLTLLSGARRQIFTVFSIFLLVDRLHFSLREMSLLFLFNFLISWFLNPLIGQAINRVGERALLSFKYILLIAIFLTYAFTQQKWVIVGLYITEQLLFNFTINMRTFFQKIAAREDIAPSMAVGATINHIAAVIVPIVGGSLWMIDYRIPFFMGLAFSLCSLFFTQFIPRELRKAKEYKKDDKSRYITR